jgi:hypothetical protein
LLSGVTAPAAAGAASDKGMLSAAAAGAAPLLMLKTGFQTWRQLR